MSSDFGQRLTQAEAEWWQELADKAEQEALRV